MSSCCDNKILLLPWHFNWIILKSYLHCKMTTFQNVSCETRLNFFKGYVPFSRYSSFCSSDHLIIYQICDVMMSVSAWEKVHLWMHFLNHNSLNHQTWSAGRYKQAQFFLGIIWTIWRTGVKFQSLFKFPTCSNYSKTSYV